MAENEAEKKDVAPAAPNAGAGEKNDAPAATTAAAKPAPPRLLAVALLLGMIAGSASAAVVVASLVLRAAPHQRDAAADKDAEEPAADKGDKAGKKSDKSLEFTLENPLIVNVYQTQERRYLSVKPVLVMSGSTAMEKVKTNQSELQHVLIGIFKGKTLEQLDDPDAANVIGREVQEAANLKLNLNNAITRVYFTQFVVQ